MKIFTLTLGDFAVNTYIVFNEGSGVCAIIDPGDDFKRIKQTLYEKSLFPGAIILTHSHFDHIGSLIPLREEYGCKVYLHSEETEMLGDADKNLSSRFCDLPIEFKEPDILLQDGEQFEVAGLVFDVIHTPGHSKGCAVYRCGNVLFTGDTLFDGCCGRCDLWSSNAEDMRRSLDRLFAIEENLRVMPGHADSTTLDAQRKSYKLFI